MLTIYSKKIATCLLTQIIQHAHFLFADYAHLKCQSLLKLMQTYKIIAS